MKFTKREIERKEPPTPEPPKVEAPPKVENEKKKCATCGENSSDADGIPRTISKRFLMVQIPSEMFEYSDIKRSVMTMDWVMGEMLYNQSDRETVITYPVESVNGKQVIEDVTDEMKKFNKKPVFSMRSLNVANPDFKAPEGLG